MSAPQPRNCTACRFAKPDWLMAIISFGIESRWQYAKCRHLSAELTAKSHYGKKPEYQYCNVQWDYKCQRGALWQPRAAAEGRTS